MKKLTNNKYLLQLAVLCTFLLSMGAAQAAEHCADSYSIDETLPSGARWDMCWTHDNNHGIRYHHIYYTPKNGTRRMVLMDAAVAQIHVPYDDNGARYHDVSDYGLGGGYLRNLSAAECTNGTRRQYGSKNAVCTQVQTKGAAYRLGDNVAVANALKVFSVSKVGAYVYIPQWLFYDDGRMEPSMLATGALQRYTSSESRGWLLSGNRIGLSHMHNYFWRLDFDLNGTADNDVAKEINYTTTGGTRQRTTTTFTTEAARALSPTTQRSWLISDGSQRNAKNHLMGYEIRLSEAGHREIGPSFEPYTYNDFYVTRANDCEQIASHNNRVNSNCLDSLDQFVNGQSLAGQDLVAWVGISFYHMPRSEDYPKMDAHSNHFEIIPRDWHAQSPLGTVAFNEPPVANSDTTNASGETLVIDVLANDTGTDLTLTAPNAWSLKGGSVALATNKISYTAKPGFNGEDKIWYSLTDAQGRQAWSEVTITVSGNNGAFNPSPVGNEDTVDATAAVLQTIDVLANDVGNGLVLVEPSPWSFKGGSVALLDNKLEYTAKSTYNGEDKIWYTFKDVENRQTWGVVTINVTGGTASNPAPIGNPDSTTVSSGTTIIIDVLSNDTGNGKVLNPLASAFSLEGGSTVLSNNKISYTPKVGYQGEDKIWYTFKEVEGRQSWGEVTITVTP
ncbi:MAG: Ig-like domain-containing protein [Leucothrix sp.]